MNMKKNIFILSDSTGETAATMVKAVLVHFKNKNYQVFFHKNIREASQVKQVLEDIKKKQGGLLVFTVINNALSKQILKMASEENITCVDLLTPLMTQMEKLFEVNQLEKRVGELHAVNEKYFKRIEAIEYTVKHDDGKLTNDLDLADIILVGISRTSKTPLSIFLSHKGWKVANIPIVLNQPLPKELFTVDQRSIIGLTINVESLYRIRRKRLEKFGQDPGGEYASLNHIQKEINYAENLFRENKRWPVFNVTDRALEETASEIVKMIVFRKNLPNNLLF